MRRFLPCFLTLLCFIGLLNGCTVPSGSKDLSALSDEELYETVYFRCIGLVDSYPNESIALESINSAQKAFYVLSMYDMEIQNGGLCQFFVNSSEALTLQVDACLEMLGAEDHRELFTGFVKDNGIDLQDLSSFRIDDIQDFAEQTQRYDFDSFDAQYYGLPPLYNTLIGYVRSNISEFN